MVKPDIKSARWLGPPRSYTKGRKHGQPTVIFIHTTEGSEGPNSAEDGAAYDRRRTDGTSTHLFVDSNSIVQTVEFKDEAHTARSHGNDVGIQIEVCGRAGQSRAQWSDAASAGTIRQLIKACVEIRKLYGPARFPLINLSPSELRAGKNGFAEHYDATRAWPGDGGSHTDPGPNFPWATLFAGIKAAENPPKENEVAFADDRIKVSTTTGRELFEPDIPGGTEKPAHEILQLAAIWAKRAADKEDKNATELVEVRRRLDNIGTTLAEILAILNDPGSPPGDGTTRPETSGG